ncbi:MAG: rhomboid family intramembrane serine protease [Bifidobacteriaceae bacterium]|jgi:membrane associated rhomboid family serine protease|nr:rhomboid family intramembrane serine protease [Bifidobacteriaceae bacterium]
MTNPGLPESYCFNHPERAAFVRCQRCDRPTCPSCQVPAAVGVQCVDCVEADRASRRRIRSVFGADAPNGPPWVTIGLIAACVAVTVAGMFVPDSAAWEIGFVPAFAKSEPWRLVTSMFDHLGLWHLGVNMLCLWMLGSFLEPTLGRWRFTALYAISGLAGGVAILAWASFAGGAAAWLRPTVGASGAVFGLFGAAVWVTRRLGGNAAGIVGVLVVNIVFTLANTAQVSWQGHFGGLAMGLALGAAYAYAPLAKSGRYSLIAAVSAGVLVVGLFLLFADAPAAWVFASGPDGMGLAGFQVGEAPSELTSV